MVYFPGLEFLAIKGFVALKAALTAKGAAATIVGAKGAASSHILSQAASHGLSQAVTGGASYAAHHTVGQTLAYALQQGATATTGALVVGGTVYTVGELISLMINEMRKDGHSDEEIREYFRRQYDIVFS
ncbi:hypothetical protein ACIQXD_12220 [Streptomyces uncialis]|uniref:hypothetical protein n=1 Tax=Streptomyces uncialis TaxID=1048205 RepID=UPI0038006039